MSTRSYGPFRINGREGPFCTIYVRAGDSVTVTAPASDRIHLGGFLGGQGEIGPDGRAEPAGSGFPAPSLKRHSLVFRIGDGPWIQGGSSPNTVGAATDGQVIVHINDDLLADNTGGWNVTVTRGNPRNSYDLPRSASGALFQSLDGDLRLVATNNQRPGVATSGVAVSFRRDGSFNWTSTPNISSFNNVHHPNRLEDAHRYPSWFQATDGQFWGVCVRGTQVKYFVYGAEPIDVPGANDCAGAPSMTQSRHGNRGNFELAYPTSSGQMKIRFADNNSRSCNWRAPLIWNDHVVTFEDPGTHIKAVRLLQSSHGNLEVIALEGTSAGGVRLRHFWRDDGTRRWDLGGVLPGSDRVDPASVPAFIQSWWWFQAGTNRHGNYEVIAPSREGGLLHWHFDFGVWIWASDPPIDPHGRRVKAVHLYQSNFGTLGKNFEMVAETGELLSLNNPGVGYGELLFYWCNNDRATNSHDGGWSGPFRLPF